MSNSNIGFYSFAYTLTSATSQVNIPFPLGFKIGRIKIRTLSYTTQDANNSYFLLVNILNFDGNSTYVTGAQNAPQLQKYLLYVPLNAQQASQNIYLNRYPDSWDVELKEPVGMSNLNIQCLINGQYSTLISPSAPVLIEILLSE